jgi:hypothetical protein
MSWRILIVVLLALVLSAPLEMHLAQREGLGGASSGAWISPAFAQSGGSLTCPDPSYSNEADHDAGYFVDSTSFIVQSFRVSQETSVGRVSLQISNQGPSTDDIIRVELRTSGPPPGNQVLAGRTIVDPMPAYHWADFDFDPPPTLSPDTVYYIVASGNGGPLQGFGWGVDASAPRYTDGESYTSIDGLTWVPRPDVDTMFRVWDARCPRAAKVVIIDDPAEAEFAGFVGADFAIVAPDGLGDAMMQLQRYVDQGNRIHTLIFYAHAGTGTNTAVSPPRPSGAMELRNRDYTAADFNRIATDFPALTRGFVPNAQVHLLNCTLGQDQVFVEAVARAYLRQGGGLIWAKTGNVGSFGTPTFWGLLDRTFFSVDLPNNPDLYFWSSLVAGSSGEWRAWYLESDDAGGSFSEL